MCNAPSSSGELCWSNKRKRILVKTLQLQDMHKAPGNVNVCGIPVMSTLAVVHSYLSSNETAKKDEMVHNTVRKVS